MKIAREIAAGLTDADPFNRYACITDTDGNIHISPNILALLIAEKLKPIKEVLAVAVTSQGWPTNDSDEDRWSHFYRTAREALVMFDD